jgi:hypothetical protein
VAEVRIPVDLGFTEFVSSLLAEVMQAVVANQADQERRRAELLAAASSSAEVFAEQHVSEADVEVELARLFPSTAEDRPHDAARGTPVKLDPDRGVLDGPPYEALLGVRLAATDVSAETGRLLARGERRLATAARAALAERELAVLRDVAERGLPRVVVDHGRISARLTFEALQVRAETEPDGDDVVATDERGTTDPGDRTVTTGPTVSRLARPNPLVLAGKLPSLKLPGVVPKVLEDVRLKVHTADERDAEPATGSARLYGEVELSFKTVW